MRVLSYIAFVIFSCEKYNGGLHMPDYVTLYRILFNGITDAIRNMEDSDYAAARETLIRSQQYAEDYYLDATEEEFGDDAGWSSPVSVYILPHDA